MPVTLKSFSLTGTVAKKGVYPYSDLTPYGIDPWKLYAIPRGQTVNTDGWVEKINDPSRGIAGLQPKPPLINPTAFPAKVVGTGPEAYFDLTQNPANSLGYQIPAAWLCAPHVTIGLIFKRTSAVAISQDFISLYNRTGNGVSTYPAISLHTISNGSSLRMTVNRGGASSGTSALPQIDSSASGVGSWYCVLAGYSFPGGYSQLSAESGTIVQAAIPGDPGAAPSFTDATQIACLFNGPLTATPNSQSRRLTEKHVAGIFIKHEQWPSRSVDLAAANAYAAPWYTMMNAIKANLA